MSGTKLSKAQKKKIIDVIKKDAEVIYTYETKDGQTCAIGGLAKAARIARPEGDLATTGIGASELLGFARRLAKEYGLSRDDLMTIQHRNDYYLNRTERRLAIIAYVNSL